MTERIIFIAPASGEGKRVTEMAKYECLKCGWTGKPIIMEPVTKVCPKCGSVQLKKLKQQDS